MTLDFQALYNELLSYFQNNVYISIALGVVLSLLLLRKPKLLFTIVLIIAINVASFYVVSAISSEGVGLTNKLAQRSSPMLTPN